MRLVTWTISVALVNAVYQSYCHRCTGGLLSSANDGGDRLQAPARTTLVAPWTHDNMCEASIESDLDFVLYNVSALDGTRTRLWHADSRQKLFLTPNESFYEQVDNAQ
ncbi:Aste57867_22759 [Aphanomyces stellatus]|uniref:Aste57867_22759 protein n=1 Tax=Aphanomyces stellatus TaxID=120398 RepID=A0A485LL22_9STRA|nr:hypothetical protein As57867_022689 [Aphanomyces stellatus]VFT99412.1 Aste57867_22759 [Aphanomyces stellatus]